MDELYEAIQHLNAEHDAWLARLTPAERNDIATTRRELYFRALFGSCPWCKRVSDGSSGLCSCWN